VKPRNGSIEDADVNTTQKHGVITHQTSTDQV
jgi:hypothetical protein